MDEKFLKYGLPKVIEAAFFLLRDFCRDNLGNFSEENGVRFHLDIEPIKGRYRGWWDNAMMGDYV